MLTDCLDFEELGCDSSVISDLSTILHTKDISRKCTKKNETCNQRKLTCITNCKHIYNLNFHIRKDTLCGSYSGQILSIHMGSNPRKRGMALLISPNQRPRPFCTAPRPRRGRYFLPPRDPSDRATLPTLASSYSATSGQCASSSSRSHSSPADVWPRHRTR